MKSEIPEFGRITSYLAKEEYIVFPNEMLTPKVYLRTSDFSLKIDYPIGITDENKRFINVMKIKDKEYPKHRVILVPTGSTLKKIKSMTKGDSIMLSDEQNNFHKLFITDEYRISENDNQISYMTINYDNLFTIKSYTNISCVFKITEGIVSERFEICPFENNGGDRTTKLHITDYKKQTKKQPKK